jgi:hypothetical protein
MIPSRPLVVSIALSELVQSALAAEFMEHLGVPLCLKQVAELRPK